MHLHSRERSPAPCAGQLWVARGRGREGVRNGEVKLGKLQNTRGGLNIQGDGGEQKKWM